MGEGRRDALTTLSAALFLTLSCNNRGRDIEGLAYLDESTEMGYRLGLFGDGTSVSLLFPDLEDNDTRSAMSYVAWGVFGWQT